MAVALVVALCASLAAAPPALDRAQAALDAYDYSTADRLLIGLRQRAADLTDQDMVEVLRLSALVALSLDRFDEAEDHLSALLERSASFAPPKGAWPPPWRRVFDAAKKRALDRYAPTLKITAPETAPFGQPVTIKVAATDPSGVKTVRLSLADPAVSLSMITSDGVHFLATLPGRYVRPPGLRFWVEAYDRRGNGPGYFAPPRRPTSIRVTPPLGQVEKIGTVAAPAVNEDEGSIVDTWWFWTIAGVVVAGAGVTAAVVAAQSSDDTAVRARVRFQ